MNTDQTTEELSILQYKFTVGGEKGTYETSFLISGDCLKTHCTCRHLSPCWHVEYVKAGKTSRIVGGDIHLQQEMIKNAAHTAEGRFMLRKAKKKIRTGNALQEMQQSEYCKTQRIFWSTGLYHIQRNKKSYLLLQGL